MPNWITFDSTTLTFTIETNDSSTVGLHYIKLTGSIDNFSSVVGTFESIVFVVNIDGDVV